MRASNEISCKNNEEFYVFFLVFMVTLCDAMKPGKSKVAIMVAMMKKFCNCTVMRQ
jgi:hypothetical protein